MHKVFGIGNPLLGDDGIALHLIKSLQQNPLLTSCMTFFQAETDCLYALEEIQSDDLVIVLDSCYFKNTPGTLVCMPLDACPINFSLSAHSLNFLAELQIYFPKINGFFIGIEVHDIKPSLSLSPILDELLPKLNLEVTNLLLSLVHIV